MLLRALAVVGAIAAPSLLAFALVPRLILRTAFGPDTVDAAPALVLLGLAMTLLAVSFLAVQYMLALGRVRFVWVLAAVAACEIVLLLPGGSVTALATRVLVAQLVAACVLIALGLRTRELGLAAGRAGEPQPVL